VKTILARSPARAAAILRRGEPVAFPTETVYGLGAPAFDGRAIRKIFRAKGRPFDNPLIAHIASASQLGLLASRVTPSAKKLMDRFFPGPLTVILPKKEDVPASATAGLDTIGIRMPASSIAREFLKHCGFPVVAPSANRSGRPSPTTWQAVREDLGGRIACILRGPPAYLGLESTVVDCTGRSPVVLRSGAITLEMLRGVVPSTRMHEPLADEPARSPGMKHRHYAPRAKVVLVDEIEDAPRSDDTAFIGLRPPLFATGFGLVALAGGVEEYARVLFRFFRECDASGIRSICCERVPDKGLGRALMDRLRRAAAR
jgi:L-threonylcarbamoyladenylate synthase